MRRNGVSLERTASMLGNKGMWLAILALVASARVAAADASAAIAHGGSDGAVTTLEAMVVVATRTARPAYSTRSEEHTSELQSLMRISYAVFCLKKKNKIKKTKTTKEKYKDINITRHHKQ